MSNNNEIEFYVSKSNVDFYVEPSSFERIVRCRAVLELKSQVDPFGFMGDYDMELIHKMAKELSEIDAEELKKHLIESFVNEMLKEL